MDGVLRGLFVYVFLLLVTRFSGRRTLGEMTVFEFVLLLIIAETTQQGLLGDDFSITNAAVLIVTLFTADIALAYLKGWSPRFADLIDGRRCRRRASTSTRCSRPRASSTASNGSTRSSSPSSKPAARSA
jgi:hypothetical protein